MKFLRVFLFFIFILSWKISYAADLDSFFLYDLASSKNLNSQFQIINNLSNNLNNWFGGKPTQEVLDQLKLEDQKLKFLNTELNNLVFPEELKNLQVVNIKVSDNLVKISKIFLTMVQNSNLDYADDVVNIFNKLEKICNLIYHSKIARWQTIFNIINAYNFESTSVHLAKYFEWYIQIIKLEPIQDEINRNLNLLNLQYMQRKIRQSDVKVVLKRDLAKTKTAILEIEKFKTSQELSEIHKKYIEIWKKNCLLVEGYLNFLNHPKDKLMIDLEAELQKLNELNCDFSKLSHEYLKKYVKK